jgi:F-type H+-transporting ATPase subunit b
MTLLQDPGFWYAVAFVIFIGIAFKFTRKPATAWLDDEIAKIRQELEQARRLRAEAEASLAEYTKKQAIAMADAEAIVQQAHDDAIQVKSKAEADLQAALERHEKQALNRIRMAENEAVTQVRDATIDAAMQLVRKALSEQIDDVTSTKLIEQAIKELPAAKPAKAKAAA